MDKEALEHELRITEDYDQALLNWQNPPEEVNEPKLHIRRFPNTGTSPQQIHNPAD